jgi:CDP-diacylglycerol--glycerol-3-phosphate 3-phosphatidyltransferase/cardiolipin synthase
MNKNVPNILTTARVIAVPFFVFFFYKGSYIVAFIIFVLASLTDMLDGLIARKYNLVSNFGKFMDPLADKILTYSAFCLFVEYKMIPAYFLIIVLFREFAVAGIRMLAAEKGKVIAADIFGKIKTLLQMISIPLYLLVLALPQTGLIPAGKEGIGTIIGSAAYWLMVASIVMTVVSGYNYIAKNIGVLKDE